MRKAIFALALFFSAEGAHVACAANWPLVTIREAVQVGHDHEKMEKILDLHGKHPGSVDEIWLAHAGIFTAEKTASDMREYSLLRPAFDRNGIVLGFQQGSTLGHGNLQASGILESELMYQNSFPDDAWAVGKDGRRLEVFCARSKYVQDFEENYVADVCRHLGTDSFWLDDDLRMGLWKPDACFCDRCIRAFNEEEGLSVTREELVRRLFAAPGSDAIRSKWFDFNSRSAALYAAAARRGADRAGTGCRLALQLTSADMYYRGFGFKNEVTALSDNGRSPIGVRIAGGSYVEDEPRKMVDAMLNVMREIGRCRRDVGKMIASYSYENENYTRQVLNKSWEAILKQSALGFAAGCDATTIYTFDASRPEPFEYVEEFAEGLAEWRPYFERLAAVSRRTRPAGASMRTPDGYADRLPKELVNASLDAPSLSTGFRIPGSQKLACLALSGLPIVSEEEGAVAWITDEEYDASWKPGANRHAVAEVERLRDLIDERSRGRMPVRLGKTHAVVPYPRVDGNGNLVAVTFFNFSMGVAKGMPVFLRNPAGANLVWATGGKADVALAFSAGGLPGERKVILPDIPGFGMGTVFVTDKPTVSLRPIEPYAEARFPKFRRLGAVSPNGESSPFVFKDKLMRLELSDPTRGLDIADPRVRFRIYEVESGRLVSEFGAGCYYPSVYKEGDTVYVTASMVTPGRHGQGDIISGRVMLFESVDLVNWKSRVLLDRPGWSIFNTSMTKGPDGYVIALESNHKPERGVPFTMFFARSKDMTNWSYMENDRAFPRAFYGGGPFMVFSRGYYYLFLVTELPCYRYCNYLYRTRDFVTWEVGRYNPFMMPAEEDRGISPYAHDIDDEFKREIARAFICSLSDVECCEYDGRTYIGYGLGNQRGFYYWADAWYDGPMDELLENFFR